MGNPARTSANRGGKARRIGFLVAIALASLFVLVALLFAYPLIAVNWLPRDLWLVVRADRFHPDLAAGDEVHRLHSLALGVIAWGMLLGIVLQAHRPERKIAPLLASLAVPIAMAVSEMMAGTYTVGGTAPFIVLILIVVMLHPAARDILRLPGWNLPMLGLAVAAALPWMIYATRMGRAAHIAEPGFEVGHITFMSALALLAVLWGTIGASNRAGWQYATGAAMVATAAIGLQSVIFPDALSGLSLPWAVAALAWCAAYGAAAILRTRASKLSHGQSDMELSRSERSDLAGGPDNDVV